jgi:SAM-dependent methyltransferase
MSKAPWFEDEGFWSTSYPFMFPDESFQRAASQVPKIVALAGCNRGDSVLDLCCGPGRHTVPFSKEGFKVTAVDRSSFLLGKATAYAEQERVSVTWVQEDMRRFVDAAKFNLALSLFTSFGFFDDMEENERVLRNIQSSLLPNGTLVMEMMGKERLARIFEATSSQELPNGDLMFERRFVRGDWERIENQWIVISGGETQVFHFGLWIFSARELKNLLRQAGFNNVAIHADFDGTPYGLDANRLIAVARK